MKLGEITFLIGNGFDIRCGLKSRYSDIYASYVVKNAQSAVIRDFKSNLREYLDSNGDPLWAHWSDFEMGIAEYAKTLYSESEILECLEDFTQHMIRHLRTEERAFFKKYNNGSNFRMITIREMCVSLDSFHRKLTRNNSIELFESADLDETLYFNFIDFNYTIILDTLLVDVRKDRMWLDSKTAFRTPIHIHGTLSEGLTLGIDNPLQLSGISVPITNTLQCALVKPYFNSIFDEKRVKHAVAAIQKSDVLCVFGLSLGDSDLTWRTAIKEWLLNSSDHQLIFFDHKYSNLNGLLPWQKILAEENAITEILQKIGVPLDEMRKYQQQVHVPIGESVFNIPNSDYSTKGASVAHPPTTVV